MRIISGSARGTKLYTLEGKQTRPTLDRVKESLFNIIKDNVIDSVFLDLFSGTGAIGLEAASRGCKQSILCDKSKDAIEIINKNIDKTHLSDKVKLYNIDYEKLLKTKIDKKIDIAYIDPPYNSDFTTNAIKIMVEENLLNKDSIIIVETDLPEKILKEIEKLPLSVEDTRKYGRATLIFIKII